MSHREDVYCPACPDPEAAFRLEDVGMKHGSEIIGDGLTVTVSRPAWEDVMLVHLETMDDEAHRRVYLECMAALDVAGISPEDVARNEVQQVADWARTSIEDAARARIGRSL